MSSQNSKKKRGRSNSMVKDDVEMVRAEEVGGKDVEPEPEDLMGDGEEGQEIPDDAEYEDPFEDEFEEEEIVEPKEGDDEEWEDVDENEEEEQEDETEDKAPGVIWNPTSRPLAENEELDWDSKSYEMFHILRPELSCLSFDVLLDKQGFQRRKYPHTLYFVAGSQSVGQNFGSKIFVMKATQLMRTKYDSDSEEEEDIDEEDGTKEGKDQDLGEDLDDDPELEHHAFKHRGTVNRIRSMGQTPSVVSSWSDTGVVNIWDLSAYIRALENNTPLPSWLSSSTNPFGPPPLQSFNHGREGFALDWSPLKAGNLLSGDCDKNIYLWEPNDNGQSWTVRPKAFSSHKGSVEDLQWSPSEQTVFASCSIDKTIKIWDTRDKSGKAQLSAVASSSDVNVISWNPNVSYLLLSGSDDSTFSIWDLRSFSRGQATAHFNWHKGPITSVEWNPNDDSELAVASEDNWISIWDMSLERDDTDVDPAETDLNVPPQLLFLHHGQVEVKEVHWHPQIPGLLLSTAVNGFNVFKPDITTTGSTTTASTTTTESK